MSAVDLDALRAHVISVFDGLAEDLHDESAVNTVCNTVVDAALFAIRARLRAWNQQHAGDRLPLEVLASSFQHLSFRDKISVSHVCHSWRAAAVGFPAVWAEIELPPVRAAASLLKLALSRAGNLPVELSFSKARGDGQVESVVGLHLHRFKSISWQASLLEPDDMWNRPAPFLERLSCKNGFLISEFFLCEQAGSLKNVELGEIYLPPRAPALSTVTSLSGWEPRDMFDSDTSQAEKEEQLSRLFEIFPHLESLALWNLHQPNFFPRGPVPPTLTRLELHSTEELYNPIDLYVAWKTERLSHIEITTTNPQIDIAPLLAHVRHLTVDVRPDKKQGELVAVDARGHRSTVVVTHRNFADRRRRFQLVESILHASPALAFLESLEISLDEFRYLLDDPQRPNLSTMTNLTVRIREIIPPPNIFAAFGAFPSPSTNARPSVTNAESSLSFPWWGLECLARLRHMQLQLQSLTLAVRCINDSHFPTHHDALQLLQSLPHSDYGSITLIAIRGFPAAVVREVDTNSVPNLQIKFE